MCLAIPARILDIDDDRMGTVDIMGVTRKAAFDLCPEAVPGDYVLVHAGFAIQVVDEEDARETLELIEQLPDLAAQEASDQPARITSARG